MSGQGSEAEQFMSAVAILQRRRPQLTGIQAGLITAAELGLARDSRSFARILGLPHALVLRELTELADRGEGLTIIRRDARTLRTYYELSSQS